MDFFVMCMRMQAQMWGAVVETWAQMMNPYTYIAKAKVTVTVENGVRDSEIENREEMRRALREFRRVAPDIWPEDVIGGGK